MFSISLFIETLRAEIAINLEDTPSPTSLEKDCSVISWNKLNYNSYFSINKQRIQARTRPYSPIASVRCYNGRPECPGVHYVTNWKQLRLSGIWSHNPHIPLGIKKNPSLKEYYTNAANFLQTSLQTIPPSPRLCKVGLPEYVGTVQLKDFYVLFSQFFWTCNAQSLLNIFPYWLIYYFNLYYGIFLVPWNTLVHKPQIYLKSYCLLIMM